MKVIKDLADFPKGLAIALGAFDGVHLGHQRLIKNITEYAKANKCLSCVYTFDTLTSSAKYITDTQQKIKIFEDLGVDCIYIQKFDDKFKSTPAKIFLDNYIKDAKYISVGYNFRFGKGREGNTGLLKDFCEENGIAFHIEEPVCFGSEVVSSTKIRGYIEESNFETARKMLGRNFCVTGTVVHGNEIGRTMGFPTANICTPENRIMPDEGVYATLTEYGGSIYPSVTNYGSKPTFKNNEILLETHIFDFNELLYDKNISVHFLEKLRNVALFSSKEELKRQLEDDKNKSLEIFKKSLYK